VLARNGSGAIRLEADVALYDVIRCGRGRDRMQCDHSARVWRGRGVHAFGSGSLGLDVTVCELNSGRGWDRQERTTAIAGG
jgi:hypothetical protein